MATQPGASLPTQCGNWADLKAAYRFLDNDHVQPTAMGRPHREQTRRRCGDESVVLCVQDGTDFQSVKVPGNTFMLHSTLAVTTTGDVLGLLDQRWYDRIKTPPGETRKQRAARWRESDVWIEAAQSVGTGPQDTQLIHVADRAADDLRFMHACIEQNAGFIVRARHDRCVEHHTHLLWPHMQTQPVCGELTVTVGAQRDHRGRITRRKRSAKVSVRFATVHLDMPQNHPGVGEALTVQAVYLQEINPPDDVEPIQWMLLTSESVSNFDEARRIIGFYEHRWVIEQWHRVLKEGCRLERSQLHDVTSLQRLAAVLSVVAVRLLQLRDLADAQRHNDQADDPLALQRTTPPLWIAIVATLARTDAKRLTPQKFWHTLARRGGWIGRRSDGRPGWQTLWRGWSEIATMVRGVELTQQTHDL